MLKISENNKRIVKNTLMLYIRMLFSMAIGLYTSRVILSTLGIDDYGIYNVVGSIVAMFSVLSRSLSSAISRFITFELGKGDYEKLNKIFSSAVTIQIGLAVIIIIIAEGAGVWFVNTKMVIPDDRLTAANWVFHISLLSFGVNLISVPYNACIIAHEKMSAFARVSILEVMCKLLIACLITISPIDRLIFYAILNIIVALIIRSIYAAYCKRHFEECSYHFIWDRDLLRQMFGYAGWNFIGSSSAGLRDEGGNVIINLFAGPTVNAARGIASQVNYAIQGFAVNFMMALNPQITKSYASGNREYMMTLIYQGARLSFYMLLLLSLPILINTHYILTLWLKEVPEHIVLFVQLSLVFAMEESISAPLITANNATGRIRNYQLVVGGLQMLNLPVSYLALRLGAIPESVVIIAIVIGQICLAARLFMLRSQIGLNATLFIKKIYINILVVSAVSFIVPWFVCSLFEESFTNFLLITVLTLLYTFAVIYYVGCNAEDRKLIIRQIHKIKNKIHN